VGQVLMSAPLRNVFGQVKSKIDPRFIMDRKRIFIANLSKGRLGEDKANLLGSLLVSKFHTAAMERADVPETNRVDFNLYIDEFQNFGTDSFANILSEARKYRLNLTLAHQYVGQMAEEVGMRSLEMSAPSFPSVSEHQMPKSLPGSLDRNSRQSSSPISETTRSAQKS